MKTVYHCRRMALWDYFKRKGSLPDPKGYLATIIPSSAIAAANSEVENRAIHSKRLKKKAYCPRERAQIGKLACTIGATASAKSFSRKLRVTINESTVCGCKKAYIAERTLKDVSITLAPWPSTMASQAGLLNSAYFFVWRENLRD